MLFIYELVNTGKAYLDSFDKQQFSKDLVLTILVQIFIIIADRIIYKLRSIKNDFIITKFKRNKNTGNTGNSNTGNNNPTSNPNTNLNTNSTNENNIENSNSSPSILVQHTNTNTNTDFNNIHNTNLEYVAPDEDMLTSNIALSVKLVLHYTLLFLVHYILFFSIPLSNHTSFFNNLSLQILYLLCCIYFYYSASQIKYGFPLITRGQYLVNSTQLTNRMIFKTYRGMPFLYELRAILDWTITKTSLDLFQWFKLEDAYANLYDDKCEMDIRKWRKPRRSPGMYAKSTMGVMPVFVFNVCSYITYDIILVF